MRNNGYLIKKKKEPFKKSPVDIYSSRYKTGSLKVRFDVLEPEFGGRVKGTILEATLYGFYQRQEDMTTLEPKRPKKLEIYNFKFDTTFERHVF